MVKVYERYIHVLGGRTEVKVVETAHLPAFVLASPEKLFFSKFKGPPIKQLLILIWPLPSKRRFFLNLLKDLSLLF